MYKNIIAGLTRPLKKRVFEVEPYLNPDYYQDEPVKIISLFYDEN